MTSDTLESNHSRRRDAVILLLVCVLGAGVVLLAAPGSLAAMQGFLFDAQSSDDILAPDPACAGNESGAAWVADSGLVVEDAAVLVPPADGDVFPTNDSVVFSPVSVSATDDSWVRIDSATAETVCAGAINVTAPLTIDRDDGRPLTVETGTVDLLAIGPDDDGTALVTLSSESTTSYPLTIAGVPEETDLALIDQDDETVHDTATVDDGTATLEVPDGDRHYLTVQDVTPVVESITLEVSETELIVGEQTNATVTAHYDDNTTEEVTENATLTSENESVVSVTDDGTITAESDGQVNVTATYESASDTVVVTVVEDEPDVLPHSFYGTIHLNGEPAPAGTVIEAKIDGEVRGSIEVTEEGRYGGPDPLEENLAVSGTAADENKTIEFTIEPETDLSNGTADQTASFQSNELTELNLTATLEEFLPPIYDLEIDNDGSPTVLGFPGTVNGTLEDLFPAGYDGVQTFWAYTHDEWELVIDGTREFDALDTLVVSTTGEGPGTIPVEVRLETNVTAQSTDLSSGWTLVAAPTFTDAETAFGTDVEHTLLVLERYSQPQSAAYDEPASFGSYVIGSTAWGVSAPEVAPFTGYFVYASDSSSLDPVVTNIEHKQDADELLGLEGK